MLERQRLEYLSNLGVESYVPRRLLSGAQAPYVIADELLVDPSIDNAQVKKDVGMQLEVKSDFASADVPAQASHAPNSLKALVDDKPIAEEKIPEKSAVPANEVSIPPSTPAIEFALSVWRVHADCLVIDSRQPGSALPTDRLLQNMLRAIGYSLTLLPQSEIIRWPLFKNQNRKANTTISEVDEARAMVHAYVQAQITKQPLKTILIMGETATLYLLGSDKPYSEVNGTLFDHKDWNVNIAVLPSLVSMLENPLEKRIAWQALQAIVS